MRPCWTSSPDTVRSKGPRPVARAASTSTRYDDVFGPVALVVILVLVAVSAVALSVASIDWQSVRYARAVS